MRDRNKGVTFKPLKQGRLKCNLCGANVGKGQKKLHKRTHENNLKQRHS